MLKWFCQFSNIATIYSCHEDVVAFRRYRCFYVYVYLISSWLPILQGGYAWLVYEFSIGGGFFWSSIIYCIGEIMIVCVVVLYIYGLLYGWTSLLCQVMIVSPSISDLSVPVFIFVSLEF